jgi:hypothetical protein
VADPLARDQEALVGQRLVGQHHGVARDPERVRQAPARRQRAVRGEPPVEDGIDEVAPKLGLQADLAVVLDRKQKLAHAGPSPLLAG